MVIRTEIFAPGKYGKLIPEKLEKHWKDWTSGAQVKFILILHFYFQIEKKTSENTSNDVKPVCFGNISENFSLESFSYWLQISLRNPFSVMNSWAQSGGPSHSKRERSVCWKVFATALRREIENLSAETARAPRWGFANNSLKFVRCPYRCLSAVYLPDNLN